MTTGPRDLPETRERRQHDDDDSGDRDLPALREDSAFDHDTDEDEPEA